MYYSLTFAQKHTLVDASAAVAFWNHCCEGEIAHDKQFPISSQCVQLYSLIIFSYREYQYLYDHVFKSSAVDF